MSATKQPPTVKAALDYAEKLERDRQREVASDIYASPYRPPSEHGVRKLCQRLANQAVLQLPPDATDEAKAHARAQGPAKAIEYMRSRAAMHQREAREHAVAAANALKVHAGRQRKHREKQAKALAHLSPGTRIDGVLARLSMVASPAAAQMGQSVHGGTPDYSPKHTVDAADKARQVAVECAQKLEAIERDLKARDVQKAAA